MDLIENKVVPVLYCIIAVVGIIGNGLVIFLILKSKDRFKSPTEVYVGNLALADFLFVATLPFWAHDLYTQEWPFGAAACKIMSSMSYLNMFGSIFFLAMMGIDRRLAVVQAVASRKNRTVRSAWIRSVVVWAATIPFAAFPVAFRDVIDFDTGTACVWDFPEDHRATLVLVYSISRLVIGFVIPTGIICFCYSNIIVFMKKRNKLFKKNFKELNKVTRMVTAIIVCFVLAWLPNQIVNFKHLMVSPCPLPDDSTYESGEENDDEWSMTSFSPVIMTINHTEVSRDYLPTTNSTIPAYLYNLNTMISQTTESQLEKDYASCHRTMRRIHMITVCLGFSNSIMNPFIYAFFASIPKKKLGSFSTLNALWMRRTSSQRKLSLTTTAKFRSTAITSDYNGKGTGKDKAPSPDLTQFESRPEEKVQLFLSSSTNSQHDEESGQHLNADIRIGSIVR